MALKAVATPPNIYHANKGMSYYHVGKGWCIS